MSAKLFCVFLFSRRSSHSHLMVVLSTSDLYYCHTCLDLQRLAQVAFILALSSDDNFNYCKDMCKTCVACNKAERVSDWLPEKERF